MYANKIEKLKTLIAHPNTNEHERASAITILAQLEYKRQSHPWVRQGQKTYAKYKRWEAKNGS